MFRTFVMETYVNSTILLTLPNKKALLLISIKHQLKYLNDLKTLGQDMHFRQLSQFLYIYLRKIYV